jgi:16S rRNA (guanine966-N2)-methyltransferase
MTKDSSKARNRLRIIGGEWRSRVVSFADIPDIRPTPDRVRETLFNWLQGSIVGAKCLDLFAGSGVLSFEALSRGAASVLALELDPKAAAVIRDNASQLKTVNLQFIQKNALDWLRANNSNQQFDVVFVDPPFAAGLYESCFGLLQQNGLLAPAALVYVEADQP